MKITKISLVIVVLILSACQQFFDNINYVIEEDCSTPCWLGIQPTISTRSNVEQILNNLNIEYEIIVSEFNIDGDDYTFNWSDNIPVLSNEASPDEMVYISIWFDGRNDTVWRISFTPTNLCIHDVVRWFGLPDLIGKSDFDGLEIIYLDESFILSTTRTSQGIIGWIFFNSSTFTQYWASIHNENTIIAWDDIVSTFTCQPTDNLNPFR